MTEHEQVRTVEIAGAQLHVQVCGSADAPVLVLLHGLGNDLRLWDAQAAAFGERHRVLRFDVVGHGRSSVPASCSGIDLQGLAAQVLGVMDALQVARAALAGTSMGAVLGLAAAGQAPQRFSRLVLCGARLHTQPEAVQDLRSRAAHAAVEGLAPVAEGMISRWFPAEGRALAPTVIEQVRQTFLATNPAAYAACASALADYDLRPQLAALRQPVLLVVGALDEGIPAQFEALMAGRAGHNLSYLRMPSVGHFPNLQDPQAFNTRVGAFLSA